MVISHQSESIFRSLSSNAWLPHNLWNNGQFSSQLSYWLCLFYNLENVNNFLLPVTGQTKQARATHSLLLRKKKHLAPVVQTLDSAIHWINHYPLDNSIGFASVYPLDSDLSGGQRYPSFEQPGPGFSWFRNRASLGEKCRLPGFTLHYWVSACVRVSTVFFKSLSL